MLQASGTCWTSLCSLWSLESTKNNQVRSMAGQVALQAYGCKCFGWKCQVSCWHGQQFDQPPIEGTCWLCFNYDDWSLLELNQFELGSTSAKRKHEYERSCYTVWPYFTLLWRMQARKDESLTRIVKLCEHPPRMNIIAKLQPEMEAYASVSHGYKATSWVYV